MATPGVEIYTRNGLVISCMLMAFALLLSIAGNLYQVWAGASIHYMMIGSGVRMSRPGEVPHQAIRDVATQFILLIGNGSPAGLAQNWDDAERYMSSSAKEAFDQVKSKQLPLIEKGDISLTTENISVTRIDTHKTLNYVSYVAHLNARQIVRYGHLNMGSVGINPTVTMTLGNKGADHGLWITDFHWPPMSVPTGPILKGMRS